MKYPWPRTNQGKESRKWGSYTSETDDFEWARLLDEKPKRKSAEAELMDWADDVAYSVHDLEDYYKAGRIPLDRLINDDDGGEELERFIQGVFEAWDQQDLYQDEDTRNSFETAFRELIQKTVFSIRRPFTGEKEQRHELRQLTSLLINRYIAGIHLREPTEDNPGFVEIDSEMEREITMLKELTWHYVIRNPALATIQHGQRKVIEGLFEIYFDALADRSKWHILPPRYQDMARTEGVDANNQDDVKGRIVCDLIAGMSEQQAVELYHQLSGIRLGSPFTDLLR